ncbi:heme o synthase [Halalkalicoccus sp. NIPERK01]|uniref:heme o synthase n=1 Tax=Halalkalicoccus sp. NIPERK01 TaxID=3053469 RepID=UPI00256F4B36|nr:heme o synthase [Halalkalicoccus sp. NIPERK01]MDL5363657.1 heme o synthase [Halalkalicoccus sp. NIPERK01]
MCAFSNGGGHIAASKYARSNHYTDVFTEPLGGRSRALALLAATAVGAYLLVIAGATTALTDAAAACSTWPACNGGYPFDGAEVTIAWTHRVLAALVGVGVLASAVVGWRTGSTRIRLALVVPAVLYPVQVAIGAVVATAGAPPLVSALHLLIGTVIFGGLLLGLAWSLERRFPTREREESLTREPDEPARGSTPNRGLRATLGAYYSLMKPRLMWLLCLVAAAAMTLATGPDLSVTTIVATLLGGVLAIGASGTFNHVLERDVDRRMKRTAARPLATEIVPVRHALVFGTLLGIASLATFYVFVNALAALLGLTAIVFYSVIYTLVLKPNTVQNTVIGGAAGALPALIGWAAATGEIGLPALVLAGVIFCWTPAHFYNLALAYKDDYARGGFPMMPVVRGERATRKHIVYYLGATLIGASMLAAVDTLGWLFAATSVLFGAVFLREVMALHREQTRSAAMRSFHASNAYLGALLFAIIVDALVL